MARLQPPPPPRHRAFCVDRRAFYIVPDVSYVSWGIFCVSQRAYYTDRRAFLSTTDIQYQPGRFVLAGVHAVSASVSPICNTGILCRPAGLNGRTEQLCI